MLVASESTKPTLVDIPASEAHVLGLLRSPMIKMYFSYECFCLMLERTQNIRQVERLVNEANTTAWPTLGERLDQLWNGLVEATVTLLLPMTELNLGVCDSDLPDSKIINTLRLYSSQLMFNYLGNKLHKALPPDVLLRWPSSSLSSIRQAAICGSVLQKLLPKHWRTFTDLRNEIVPEIASCLDLPLGPEEVKNIDCPWATLTRIHLASHSMAKFVQNRLQYEMSGPSESLVQSSLAAFFLLLIQRSYLSCQRAPQMLVLANSCAWPRNDAEEASLRIFAGALDVVWNPMAQRVAFN